MSNWVIATRAIETAVSAPTASTTESAVCDNSYSGDMRATMKMPAVTIVAAWISAEIGVGPSIESGSQTCSGNWALLPMAPTKRHRQIAVMSNQDVPGTAAIGGAASAGACANTAA